MFFCLFAVLFVISCSESAHLYNYYNYLAIEVFIP